MGAQQVLIVEGRAGWGRDLALELRRLGHEPRTVRSPLEAIDLLVEDDGQSIRTVYVAETLGSTSGSQFVRFLGEEFPDVRPVLLASRASTEEPDDRDDRIEVEPLRRAGGQP